MFKRKTALFGGTFDPVHLGHISVAADAAEQIGAEKVNMFYSRDHTHTSAAGAVLNAACVIEGLKGLENCKLCDYLKW